MRLRIIAGLNLWLAIVGMGALGALPPEYDALKEKAEKLVQEKSFALAHDTYAKAAELQLPGSERRWVEFRLADTQWRSQAATQTADTTRLDQAARQLEALVRDVNRVEDHDRVWAEVEEPLADYQLIN